MSENESNSLAEKRKTGTRVKKSGFRSLGRNVLAQTDPGLLIKRLLW